MKLFSLSLEEDACDWYINIANDSYNYWDSFRKGFLERFGEKKDPRFLLNALHSIQRNENETMEEFNKKFRDLIASMDDEFKHPDKSILVYFIEALNGEMRYQLRGKEPVDLKVAQTLAIKIDANMKDSGKSNLSSFTRG